MIDVRPLMEVARPATGTLPFIPRRFQTGGRLNIVDSPNIKGTTHITCVLCGGLIINEEQNSEHPLPQWLHRFAGDAGERKAFAFSVSENSRPTWRQLCLASHKQCNKTFARRVEDPVISPVKSIVNGGRVTWTELDAVFDWLDKVKSASAHMATALLGHAICLGYDEISFPNDRVGAFDRLALFFRIADASSSLDLWDCLNHGFLTTPTAIALRVKHLVIVFASNNYLLSEAFGLGTGRMSNGSPEYVPGAGRFAPGFGTRISRLPTAKILAQPMRRQHRKEGAIDNSDALQESGDGKIYELAESARSRESAWCRVRSADFSTLPKFSYPIGVALAGLEIVEWIILSKEHDYARYGQSEGFFMKSLEALRGEKERLLNFLSFLTGGYGSATR